MFDVFLCYNSRDEEAVTEIYRRLLEHEVRPWFDRYHMRPGLPWQEQLESQIARINSAAVFVGPHGTGPWQRKEIGGLLVEFVREERPVIPVLLPGAPDETQLPLFLRGHSWVDLRRTDPDPWERLLQGIQGDRR